jgi:hypothetical protein
VQVLQEGVKDALKKMQLGIKVLIKGASCDPRLPHYVGDTGFVISLTGEFRLRAVY